MSWRFLPTIESTSKRSDQRLVRWPIFGQQPFDCLPQLALGRPAVAEGSALEQDTGWKEQSRSNGDLLTLRASHVEGLDAKRELARETVQQCPGITAEVAAILDQDQDIQLHSYLRTGHAPP